MSWSVYFYAESANAALQHISKLKEPTADAPYGVPKKAKQFLTTAIEMSNIDHGLAVKVEGCGSHSNGTTRVNVEPIIMMKLELPNQPIHGM